MRWYLKSTHLNNIIAGSVLKSRVLRRSQEEEQSELSDAYLDEDDQKKKINNVARRLKIIADQKVEEKKRYGK